MRAVVLSLRTLGDVKKSGVRTVAVYTSGPSWLCPGFWVNEDQNLAGLRFGFRALTRTLVVSEIAFLVLRWLSFLCRVLQLINWRSVQAAGRLLAV